MFMCFSIEYKKLTRNWQEIIEHKLPDPRGKKSFPTTLSKTEDLPELYKPEIEKIKLKENQENA